MAGWLRCGLAAAALVAVPCLPAMAQKGVPPTTVIVGGAPMVSDRDIMENLSRSAQHTVFVHLLQVAGLADTLRGHGPFTVFAPTDNAFAALPAGTLDSLQRPENKGALVALLSTQVLPGNFSAARLRYLMRAERGTLELDTLADGKVSMVTNGPLNLAVRDPRGGTAAIILYDVKQANGVVFVTDRVLMPG